MPHTPRVKAVAQLLDPECWKTYSGRTPNYKRFIDARRIAALKAAQVYVDSLTVAVGSTSAGLIIKQHDADDPVQVRGTTRMQHPIMTLGPDPIQWVPPTATPFVMPRWRTIMPETEKPTAPSRDYPWTPFKLKILLHISGSPQWSYLETLRPLENKKSQNSRVQSYNKVCAELMADGLIVSRSVLSPGPHEVTPRGRVYVEYLLSRALPEQTAPRWVMPAR